MQPCHTHNSFAVLSCSSLYDAFISTKCIAWATVVGTMLCEVDEVLELVRIAPRDLRSQFVDVFFPPGRCALWFPCVPLYVRR